MFKLLGKSNRLDWIMQKIQILRGKVYYHSQYLYVCVSVTWENNFLPCPWIILGEAWKLRVWSFIYSFSSSSWNAFILRHKSVHITLLEEVFDTRNKTLFVQKRRGGWYQFCFKKKDLKELQKKNRFRFFSLIFSTKLLRVTLSIKKYFFARVRSKWTVPKEECFETCYGYASKVWRIWQIREYRGEVVVVFRGW